MIESIRVILKDKNREERREHTGNKIGFIDKGFIQEIKSVSICNLVKLVDLFVYVFLFFSWDSNLSF